MLIPRPYQQEGINFLKKKHRAMLLDAPGLGKTLQAAEAAIPPVLVATPTYLVDQWEDFLREQYPTTRIVSAQGPRIQREAALLVRADWYIVNIEMLRDYAFPKVETIIIDESHHLRGRSSQQSKGALYVCSQAKNVYLLTGTPIDREPDDLFMQLKILYPKIFNNYDNFIHSYCKIQQTPYGPKVVGDKNPAVTRRLLKEFALGRSYKEAGLTLPELVEKVISVRMSPTTERKYKTVKETYTYDDIPLEAMVQVIIILRQLTFCKEKIEALLDTLVDNGIVHGVIFCWFRSTAEHLANLLKCPCITGKIEANDRVTLAKASKGLIVATIASLSEGVDLSHSKNVVFFECDYTYGQMYQALSRVRRYSENNDPVKVYYINMRYTVDETVYYAQRRRGITVKEILKEALK